MLELSDTRYVGAGVLSSAPCMDKHYMKVGAVGARAARRAVRGRPPGRAGERLRVGAGRRRPARLPGVRQALPRRLAASASPGCTTRTGSTPRSRSPASTTRRCWWRPRSRAARSSAACCRTLDGGEPRDQPTRARSRWSTAGHDFYDFEAKYLDGAAVRLDAARPTCRAEVADEVQAPRPSDLRGPGLRGPRPGRLLRHPRPARVVVNEVNTMPGFTPTSMYPRMWAELGDRLRGARRPAAAARPASAPPGLR